MENKTQINRRGSIYQASTLLILVFVTSCGVTTVKHDDSTEIINTLINIPDEKYIVDGTYNALSAYKGWEKLYNKYRAAARDQGHMSDIKKYLLLGFVAQLKAQVATSKAFSSGFYDTFVNHPDAVLEALKQNPFLVSSSCYYIGNYFGFESKNIEKKTVFIDIYKKKILKNLRTEGGDRCVAQILAPKRPQY